ncbi:hypothetical protein ACQY0O_000370 [Thecaphora frezii]|nr:putative glucan 1,3-beta-glucosidase [Thecaphora frezii]
MQLLTALVASLGLSALRQSQARPASVAFRSLDNSTDAPVISADIDGNFLDNMFDERGQIPSGTRVLLESRQNPGFDYGNQKVRGVNLGGWLVAEPWITPSLFDSTNDGRVVDEYTFGKYVGDAERRLQAHWNSFITEDDFRQIAAAGLNHVRIPIGYWAFDTSRNEPYVRSNQFYHLTQAVRWARKYGIKVLIDLHGAPMSQNGYDNSGQKGDAKWATDQSNADRAKAAVVQIANRFAAEEFAGTVTIIELLNEPAGYLGGNLVAFTQQYYYDAFYAVREKFANVAIMIHDAFQPLASWNGFMRPPQFEQVLLDTHIYTVFSPAENAMSNQQRLSTICDKTSSLQSSQQNLYTVVGEWTPAPTDCARYLNGRFVGARYDGSYGGDSYRIGSCSGKTGDGSNFSTSYKDYLRQMFETQVSVYERGSGWIMWTWKTEAAADWDYQRGLQQGWITRNLNSRPNAAC